MRAVTSFVLLCLLALVFPIASNAGWGGSRYEKSDCTYSKETNLLFCEETFTIETLQTEQMTIPDASCTSTLRLVRRTGTYVEPTRVWAIYEGHVPRKRELTGDTTPVIGAEFWKDFTDVDLGCV
jgi:hypothetical protein